MCIANTKRNYHKHLFQILQQKSIYYLAIHLLQSSNKYHFTYIAPNEWNQLFIFDNLQKNIYIFFNCNFKAVILYILKNDHEYWWDTWTQRKLQNIQLIIFYIFFLKLVRKKKFWNHSRVYRNFYVWWSMQCREIVLRSTT